VEIQSYLTWEWATEMVTVITKGTELAMRIIGECARVVGPAFIAMVSQNGIMVMGVGVAQRGQS